MSKFVILNTHTTEVVVSIEMDNSLLQDPTILCQDTLSLKPITDIKLGGQYTIIPIDDPTVDVLRKVHDVYTAITTKPMAHFSDAISRADQLLKVVGLLFSDVEYYVVENAQDMALAIHQSIDAKIVKKHILGDLYEQVKAAAGENTHAKGTFLHNHE